MQCVNIFIRKIWQQLKRVINGSNWNLDAWGGRRCRDANMECTVYFWLAEKLYLWADNSALTENRNQYLRKWYDKEPPPRRRHHFVRLETNSLPHPTQTDRHLISHKLNTYFCVAANTQIRTTSSDRSISFRLSVGTDANQPRYYYRRHIQLVGGWWMDGGHMWMLNLRATRTTN